MFTANSLDTTKISGDRMHSEHCVRACRLEVHCVRLLAWLSPEASAPLIFRFGVGSSFQ